MNSKFSTLLPFYDKIRTSDQLTLEALSSRTIKKNTLVPHCVGVICVLKGRLKVYITNENGKEMTLYRLFDDDVCVLSGSCGVKNISFEVQVRAEDDTELITIPGTIYHRLEEKYPEIAQFTSSMMAARLSDVMWTLEQVAFSSMDKRVASELIEQRAMVQSDEIIITHDEIARNLGTAREVVSRMLKYFQNEDWITQSRGKVFIKNSSALLELSD
jgi:CRP/FNR family transcriptional regulator